MGTSRTAEILQISFVDFSGDWPCGGTGRAIPNTSVRQEGRIEIEKGPTGVYPSTEILPEIRYQHYCSRETKLRATPCALRESR